MANTSWVQGRLSQSDQGGTMFPVIRLFTGKELGRIRRFTTVGLVATTTHAWMVLFLVEGRDVAPLPANFFAFLLAVLVSFLGHYHWTFTASTPYTTAFPRFFASALLGLGLNQTIMFCMISLLTINYRLGLAVVVILVPGVNFLVNRFWTFKPVHR